MHFVGEKMQSNYRILGLTGPAQGTYFKAFFRTRHITIGAFVIQ